MKTILSIEESEHLIRLGIDERKAHEFVWNEPCDKFSKCFRLQDILSILPKEINYNGLTYGLSTWVEYGEWHVKYISVHKGYDCLNHSDYESPELIDSLNSLLIWVIKNGHLKTEKK